MLRERVRHFTVEQATDHYRSPHDARALAPGHDLRVAATTWIARYLFWPNKPRSVADLACGNGEIACALGASLVYLGDIAPGYQIHGPLPDTLDMLGYAEPVDVIIFAETLEHLDDPDETLRRARPYARHLVASVPLYEHAEDEGNAEHTWVYDREGAEAMLTEAGWTPVLFAEVPAAPGSTAPTYQSGIWGCR